MRRKSLSIHRISQELTINFLAGWTASAKEFAKLLLDKDGSTLQEVLVEEAAKYGDAATRNFLRQALVESAVGKTIAITLRAPKDALDRSEQSSHPFSRKSSRRRSSIGPLTSRGSWTIS